MTIESGGGPKAGLIGRITGLVLRPKSEWEVIDGEAATTQGLYTGYVLILAAIPAVMNLLATLFLSSMMGAMGGFMGIRVGLSPVFAVAAAAVSYAVSLVMVYIMALLIDAFAPSFGAARDKGQAMKVAAYAPTAIWVSSLALIVPILGGLVVLAAAIYTIFVFHLGLRALMKAPEDKGVGYTAVVIIVSIVAAFVINMVASLPITMMTVGSMVSGAGRNVTLNLPNGQGTVNVNQAAEKLQDVAKQMEAAANGSGAAAADPASLQALLPAGLPGYTRTEVSSAGGAAGMMNASTAKGVYEKGESRVELTVSDMGVAGAMAGIVKVNANRETATGYEKVATIGGRMTTEEYHRDSNSGKYGVLVASRFMVEADGNHVTMDEMKAAVNAVPIDRLEAMARG